jgi:hypothetical protein
MTKDDYVLFAGSDLALIEEIAALAGKTGKELVEYISGSSIQALKEVIDRNLGASCNASIAQVGGNVIQVNFSARAAASWNGRKSYQAPSKRRQFANRISLMPIIVPCTAPASNSATVPSTSPDTVIPYSSR